MHLDLGHDASAHGNVRRLERILGPHVHRFSPRFSHMQVRSCPVERLQSDPELKIANSKMRGGKLKNQIRAILGLHPAKSLVTATVLFGLLGATFQWLAGPQQRVSAQTTDVASTPRPLSGVTSSSQNVQQIAILHWYTANLTTQFTTGTGPLTRTWTADLGPSPGGSIPVTTDAGNIAFGAR